MKKNNSTCTIVVNTLLRLKPRKEARAELTVVDCYIKWLVTLLFLLTETKAILVFPQACTSTKDLFVFWAIYPQANSRELCRSPAHWTIVSVKHRACFDWWLSLPYELPSTDGITRSFHL